MALSVNGTPLVLPKVRVKVEMPPVRILVGLKALATLGGASTVKVDVAGVGLLPMAVFRLPAGMLFGNTPPSAEVTGTVMVQPPLGIVAPLA